MPKKPAENFAADTAAAMRLVHRQSDNTPGVVVFGLRQRRRPDAAGTDQHPLAESAHVQSGWGGIPWVEQRVIAPVGVQHGAAQEACVRPRNRAILINLVRAHATIAEAGVPARFGQTLAGMNTAPAKSLRQ